MPLPTFDLQTRTYQRKLLAHKQSWANYVWLIGIEVMANRFYKNARPGDRVYAIALCPDPFVPFMAVRTDDPHSDGWLQLFIEYQREEQPNNTLHPVLVDAKALEVIAKEYIMYEWPRQLGMLQQDIICYECGMVDSVDGFELTFGVDTCNPLQCLRKENFNLAVPS